MRLSIGQILELSLLRNPDVKYDNKYKGILYLWRYAVKSY